MTSEHNPILNQLFHDVRDRCVEAGARLLWLDAEGRVRAGDGGEATEDVLIRLREALTAAGAGRPLEGVVPMNPPLHACVLPMYLRRRHCGDYLVALVQSSDPESLHQFEGAFRYWVEDLQTLAERESDLEKFGQELCEAYEEINLLYKIGQGMNVVRQPQRFISMVCRELLEVLPFRWIGVKLHEGAGVSHLTGILVGEGELDAPRHQVDRLLARFLRERRLEAALIARTDRHEFKAYEALGGCFLAYPLKKGGDLLGAVFACDKRGTDPQISTVDAKLIGATASHLQIFLDNAALYEDMQLMFLGTLEALSASIDAKDPYTCGHSQRVALLSRQLAARAGIDPETVERIHIAGLVHDVGKIGVPEAVLTKPGRLTDAEFATIRKHPEIGARILRDIPHLDDIIPGVLYHHERYDGRGYPEGLAGEAIPLFGRIIAIADSFDAMSSTRTYRRAMPRSAVLQEVFKCAGTQFDPELARIFVTLDFDEYDEMVRRHHAGDVESRGEAA